MKIIRCCRSGSLSLSLSLVVYSVRSVKARASRRGLFSSGNNYIFNTVSFKSILRRM